jgi:hypothetical protein
MMAAASAAESWGEKTSPSAFPLAMLAPAKVPAEAMTGRPAATDWVYMPIPEGQREPDHKAAASHRSPSQPPRTRGMMGDHAGMMNMMGQMSNDHMKQMTAMIDNRNRMMESMSKSPTGSDK